MNYRKLYINIVNNAKQQNRQKLSKNHCDYVYYERHHILPKSLFPLWKKRKSNLILLTPREHFFCHQLLDKIYPDTKIFLALWWLANDGQNKYCVKTSREYEKLRIRLSILMTDNKHAKNHKVSIENRKKLSDLAKQRTGSLNPFYGKVHPNWKERYHEFIKRRTPERQKEIYLKACASHKGIKRSNESRKKQSISISGKNNHQAKAVKCLTTGEIFETMRSASNKYGIAIQKISACCKNNLECKTSDNKILTWALC